MAQKKVDYKSALTQTISEAQEKFLESSHTLEV
jgi:hypothetical protein